MTDPFSRLPGRWRLLAVYWALNAVLALALLGFALR